MGVVEHEVRSGEKREKRQYEIDFVVNLGMDKLYIQSAFSLEDVGKREREILPLRKTGDSFRKLVVTGDDQPFYTDQEGISYVGILPFLLDQTMLERFS